MFAQLEVVRLGFNGSRRRGCRATSASHNSEKLAWKEKRHQRVNAPAISVARSRSQLTDATESIESHFAVQLLVCKRLALGFLASPDDRSHDVAITDVSIRSLVPCETRNCLALDFN